MTRRTAIWAISILLGAGLAAAPGSASASDRADISSSPLTIAVTGSPLAKVVTSPLALTPAFDPSITDYVLRCQTGLNTVHATLFAAGGTINALGGHGASVDIQENLVENQAMVISARAPRIPGPGQRGQGQDVDENGNVQYWIRCLPHDFPQLSVTKPGNVPPGWYLTSDFFSTVGSGVYSIVLDSNGTPVWYRKAAGGQGFQSFDVTPLPDGTVAWGGSNSFEDYNLVNQTTRLLSSPDLPLDLHELHAMPNGDLMILTSPSKPNVDLTVLGLGSSVAIADCVIEELDAEGGVVWRWRASEHISPAESLHPLGGDIYHCNSVDTDPVTGNVLLSVREADAVFLIDKTTGTIIWKMGGNSPNHDHAKILTIVGDPDGAFHAQHDARFQPGGGISLYDDQTWNTLVAARGVQYQIDTLAATAKLVWAYPSPDGRNSLATGSFRRLNAGADNVIGWGFKPNSPLFTEVDAQGRLLLQVAFTNGEFSYRVIKVPSSTLDHNFLRATAGLPAFVRTPAPTVAFVGSTRGLPTGGVSLTITGSGFTGATAVGFGPNSATAFTVNNDSSISATVPRGFGTVTVTVTTPTGSTPAAPASILTAIDSDFDSDIGSWRSANTLTPTTAFAHSSTSSLQLSSSGKGNELVATSRYAVPPRALVNGSEWVLTPQRPDHARAYIAFYDANGALIAATKGPLVTTASGAWTRVAVSGVSPAGTASAALGFEDTSGGVTIYVDSASLSGSNQFSYRPPGEEGSQAG